MKILSKTIRKSILQEMETESGKHIPAAEYGSYNVWCWLESRARYLHRRVENCLLYVMESGYNVKNNS